MFPPFHQLRKKKSQTLERSTYTDASDIWIDRCIEVVADVDVEILVN